MRILLFLVTALFCFSARANKFVPVKTLVACDMSLASCTSIGLDINQLTSYAVQAVFTGAPVGTLTLEISSDDVLVVPGTNPAANVTHWTTYTGSSQAVAAAGSFMWNVFPAGYRWMRMVYTKTSGTGSLSSTFNGKD